PLSHLLRGRRPLGFEPSRADAPDHDARRGRHREEANGEDDGGNEDFDEGEPVAHRWRPHLHRIPSTCPSGATLARAVSFPITKLTMVGALIFVCDSIANPRGE